MMASKVGFRTGTRKTTCCKTIVKTGKKKGGNPNCTRQNWANAGAAQPVWLSAQVAPSGPALQSR